LSKRLTRRCGHFSRVEAGDDLDDLDVEDVSFGVTVDEHVAAVRHGERVQHLRNNINYHF